MRKATWWSSAIRKTSSYDSSTKPKQHISGKNGLGRFMVRRTTIRKRMRAKLRPVKQQLRRRMHGAKGAGQPTVSTESGSLPAGGTRRISREAYVRIREGLGVNFPGPTRRNRQTVVPTAILNYIGSFSKLEPSQSNPL